MLKLEWLQPKREFAADLLQIAPPQNSDKTQVAAGAPISVKRRRVRPVGIYL
jgi:hypothetical protein